MWELEFIFNVQIANNARNSVFRHKCFKSISYTKYRLRCNISFFLSQVGKQQTLRVGAFGLSLVLKTYFRKHWDKAKQRIYENHLR